MLSALLLGYPEHGPDRVALLCEISFAQLVSQHNDASLASARLAVAEATQAECVDSVAPRAVAAASLALVLAVRGPAEGSSAFAAELALSTASDFMIEVDQDDPVAPMAAYLVAEAALLHGHFFAAEEAARRGRIVALGRTPMDPRDPRALVLSELVLARSVALRGRRQDGEALATRATERAAKLGMHSPERLGRALQTVIAATYGDRARTVEAERRARRLATPVRDTIFDTAAWALLSYAATLQGRHAEAVDQLVRVAGGPDLPRLPWSMRPAVFEKLASLAISLDEGDRGATWLNHMSALTPNGTPSRRPSSTSAGSGLNVLAAAAQQAAGPQQNWSGPGDHPDIEGAPSIGWQALAPRERHVAELASRGLSNRQIAERLFLSERAIRLHLGTVFRTLEIHSRSMLPMALTGILDTGSPTSRPAALTQRQQWVASRVADGWTNARIAEDLGMSVKTVEKHLRDVFTRWGVTNRSAVASRWREQAVAQERTA